MTDAFINCKMGIFHNVCIYIYIKLHHHIVYFVHVHAQLLSHVQLFATPWTAAHQGPLSTGFSRQQYWSRLPSPTPGDVAHLGIEPMSPVSLVLAGEFLTHWVTWEASLYTLNNLKLYLWRILQKKLILQEDFPGGPVVKNPPANTEDTGSIPGPGRSDMLRGNQAHVPQPLKPEDPRAHAPQQEKPPQWEAPVPQLEKAHVH